VKLLWSAFALADRDGIFTHIQADNPRAAIAVDERIAAAARRLVDFPESGRPGRVAGTASSSSPARPTSPPTR
jgi:plasmid stabilization system protein ParE